MIKGKTLMDLADEITRIEDSKKDLIVPTEKLTMTSTYIPGEPEAPRGLGLAIDNGQTELVDIGPVAHEQIADRLKIPRRYYQRMAEEAPDLLSQNVNTWLHRQPEKRLVRILDGRARAFLSDRYRPLDNYMLASAAFPALRDQIGLEILSCQITERRLYVQAVTTAVSARVVGDVIQAGCVVSNSEVGCGSVKVESLLYTLACQNGMIRAHSLKRHHVGKRINADDVTNYEIYESETIAKDNEAFMLKIRDVVRHAFNEAAFRKDIQKLEEAADRNIETGKIEDVVEDVTKRFSLSEDEGKNALHHLIEGGRLNQYGLANSVTRIANDLEDYDRAVELERVGGQIIDLSDKEWAAINN